jgi:hypothetical protein
MAAKGSADARRALDRLWAPYFGAELRCFMCQKDAGFPPAGTQAMPETDSDSSKIVLVPLCAACWALPPIVRANACLVALKEMQTANGKAAN